MLQYGYYQEVLFGVEPESIKLEENSVERWLPEILPQLVSREDFVGFYKDSAEGNKPCCPVMLVGALILQFLYDVSDRELVKRIRRDLGWQYALKLSHPQDAPSVSTVVRFRSKLRQLKGDDFIYKSVLKMAQSQGALHDTELQAVDSTNTDSRGAVIDTYNLIAAGIKRVLQTVSQSLGQRPGELAKQWGLNRYLARSIKGQVTIDWHNKDERNRLLTEEITDAHRLNELVNGLSITLPPSVAQALELLHQVAHQDVEEYEPGKYRMINGTSKGRVVSITDPEARHGRKSSAKLINGFKVHVLGTIESQFVTGIHITDASVHDHKATPALLEQSETNNVKPEQAVGDAAYGAGENIRRCAEQGVEILTKIPAPSHKESFSKHDFNIDLELMKVTCPAGQSTQKYTMVKSAEDREHQVAKFHFATQTCQACPLNERCCADTAKGFKRKVRLNLYEPELQKTRAFNASPEAEKILKSRSSIERLISHLVKMGMRHARFFGMHMVQFQAYMIAAVYNLKRYITLATSRC